MCYLSYMRTVFVSHNRYGGSYKLGNLVKVVAGSFQNSHQLNMASTQVQLYKQFLYNSNQFLIQQSSMVEQSAEIVIWRPRV